MLVLQSPQVIICSRSHVTLKWLPNKIIHQHFTNLYFIKVFSSGFYVNTFRLRDGLVCCWAVTGKYAPEYEPYA